MAGLACAAIALGACNSVTERTRVQVGYYEVPGKSFEELDRQIALHGPHVDGVGKAIASTSVRMMPDIRFRRLPGECSVAFVRVRVSADVTLPRLSDRKSVDAEMQGAYANIEDYARLHEAVHVAIADKYAGMAEERIRSLPAAPDCNRLSASIEREYSAVMKAHEREQIAFDEEEKRRFAKLARERSS